MCGVVSFETHLRSIVAGLADSTADRLDGLFRGHNGLCPIACHRAAMCRSLAVQPPEVFVDALLLILPKAGPVSYSHLYVYKRQVPIIAHIGFKDKILRGKTKTES